MPKNSVETDRLMELLTAVLSAFNLDGPALVARALKTAEDHPVENSAAFRRRPPSCSLHALGRALRGLDLISDAVWIGVLAETASLPVSDRKALDISIALPLDDPRRPELDFMRARCCVVFRRSAVSETHCVATTDPEDRFTLSLLQSLTTPSLLIWWHRVGSKIDEPE